MLLTHENFSFAAGVCEEVEREAGESLVEAEEEEEEREGVVVEDHAAEVAEEPIAGDGVEHVKPPSSMSSVGGCSPINPTTPLGEATAFRASI